MVDIGEGNGEGTAVERGSMPAGTVVHNEGVAGRIAAAAATVELCAAVALLAAVLPAAAHAIAEVAAVWCAAAHAVGAAAEMVAQIAEL